MKPLRKKDIKFIYSETEAYAHTFPIAKYYAVKFQYPPAMISYRMKIDALILKRRCVEELGAELIHQHANNHTGERELDSYVLEFPRYPGYLLETTRINYSTEDDYVDTTEELSNDDRCSSDFSLLIPPPQSQLHDPDFERKLDELIKQTMLKKRPGIAKIRVMESRGHAFTLIEKSIKQDFTIQDLDINYGHGFTEFHNDLMTRFKSSHKGLVLLHGVPGTGKTYYIRHLLKELSMADKVVIYMPPNLVENITEPLFMSVLSTWVENLSRNGQYCVLLIEDAEPLLTKREEGVRVQGISNLLNMTDGLLNDVLNLQIICTFNVGLRKLDSALLRPGRLLARKEFKPLSVLDANLLSQRLGVKRHFTKPTRLGEIYALLQNQNTLVHDVESTNDTSTPIDDLV